MFDFMQYFMFFTAVWLLLKNCCDETIKHKHYQNLTAWVAVKPGWVFIALHKVHNTRTRSTTPTPIHTSMPDAAFQPAH